MVRSESVATLLAAPATSPTSSPTPTPSPIPAPVAELLAEWPPIAWGFEERAAVSAGLLVLVVVLGLYVAPLTIQRLRETYRERLATEPVDGMVAEVDGTVPLAQTTYYVVRTVQLALVATASLTLLVVWGLTGVALTALELFVEVVPRLLQLLFSIGLVVAAYVAVDLLEEFVDRIARGSDRLDEHQGEIVFRVLQVVLLVSAGLVVLTIWDVNAGGLLVGAGFLGIVVGMAARQTLGSLLAGFVLMFSKPFEVGDWIEVNDQEGVVTDITIVNTRLENFDGEYVVMPNDVISNSTIVNRTRKGRLRVRLEVGVDYGVDPDRAVEVATDAVTELEEVMSVPRPQVVPTAFGDSAVLLELRFWIDKPSSRRRWRAKAAVIQAIHGAFQEAGIEIPYPQRTLSGRAGPEGLGGTREPPAESEAAPESAED